MNEEQPWSYLAGTISDGLLKRADEASMVSAFEWWNEAQSNAFCGPYMAFDMGESYYSGLRVPDRYFSGWAPFKARPRLHQRALTAIKSAWDATRFAIAYRFAPEMRGYGDDDDRY